MHGHTVAPVLHVCSQDYC